MIDINYIRNNSIEFDNNQYNDACKIFWASGTAFITKKDIFQKVGGFDEFFFCHMEEIDYHWKCQRLGYKVWSQPTVFLYHKGAQTLNYGSSEKIFYNHRNSLILLLVHLAPLKLVYSFSFRFILELVTLMKYIFSFQFSSSIALIRAWFSIIKNVQYIINKRNNLISNQFILSNKIDEIYSSSIVVQYFLLKVRKFSELKFTNHNT